MLPCHVPNLRHPSKVTYHLLLRLGARALKRKGRMKKSLGCSGPILSSWVSKKILSSYGAPLHLLVWETSRLRRSHPKWWGSEWAAKRRRMCWSCFWCQMRQMGLRRHHKMGLGSVVWEGCFVTWDGKWRAMGRHTGHSGWSPVPLLLYPRGWGEHQVGEYFIASTRVMNSVTQQPCLLLLPL